MKNVVTGAVSSFLVSLFFVSVGLAATPSIFCLNEDAPQKGPNQCDHYLIKTDDEGRTILMVYNPTSGNSCGTLVYISEMNSNSSGTEYYAAGSGKSSNGWDRPTHTYAEMDVDLTSGSGELRLKEGKWPEVFMKAWERSKLSNCQAQ